MMIVFDRVNYSKYQYESLTSEAISWSQRWGEQPPAEVSREMRRIEDKAS